MITFDFLGNAGIQEIEELYKKFKEDPESIEQGWRQFFEGFDFALQSFAPYGEENEELIADEFRAINLINAYRERGHYFTLTNPVRARRKYSPTLDYENFGLKHNDLDRKFAAGKEIGIGTASLGQIISHLKQTYCRTIAVEFMYIRKPEIVDWLKRRMESRKNTPAFSKEDKFRILQKVNEAVSFERFIHTKYPGQKSFSLEGAESLIPALQAIIDKGARSGYREFVIGMSHRGRLNVLANILHKSYGDIFTEFEGRPYQDVSLQGDVKYHLGYSSEYEIESGEKVQLTLCPNPSHLDAVNPVVEGIVRAKIDQDNGITKDRVIPILIHGDASVSGQGIIYEVLQMSELPGFSTGGTIHLVVNNQIGFTTNYLDGRSSIYCTDIAKIIQSPIFHVNSDDVEAVVYTVLLAMEYREKFQKDVFVDLLCYRKHGHNESDEPRFTQPVLYKIIEKHPNPLQIYIQQLTDEKILEASVLKNMQEDFNSVMERDYLEGKQKTKASIQPFLEKIWTGFQKATDDDIIQSTETGIPLPEINEIASRITDLPPDKPFFRKLVKIQNDRRTILLENGKSDWALAELLAFGSLLKQGIPVRLSGQDVERGTFSQRHAVFTIEDSEEEFAPLNHIANDQAHFDIVNSLLSEYGVLGFDYGYSLASPNALVIWEAQFGDFSNGAQIIIDQYISCAEEKWNVYSGIVLLLPHGYEGQGPEHSSGRMERFLSLCADNNMQIVNPTTPSNYFHLLRRQVLRSYRKPLIVFTPKSLLRHPLCVSNVGSFVTERFMEVIDDESADALNTNRIIFCSGKIYYDLFEVKQKQSYNNTAIIRIEQIYPFPLLHVEQIIRKYSKTTEYLWVQEEPANMGAWTFVSRHFKLVRILMIARPDSGSPASGSSYLHKQQQRKIIEKAFSVCDCENVKDECKMFCSEKEWNK